MDIVILFILLYPNLEEDLHSLRITPSQARNLQPHSHGRDFKTILKDCQAPQRI